MSGRRSHIGLGPSPYTDTRTWKMTPAMLRARRPYFWKNAGMFLVLTGVSVSIYAYTFRFLNTDDFADVPIPPISESELAKLRQEYEASKEKK